MGKITEKEREFLLQHNNWTLKELAKHLDISQSSVSYRRKKLGITTRDWKIAFSKEQEEFLRQHSDWSGTKLAKHFGVSPNTIYRWEKSLDIDRQGCAFTTQQIDEKLKKSKTGLRRAPNAEYVNNRTPMQFVCSCGQLFFAKYSGIQSGDTKTCGHCNDPKVGDKFGKLTVVEVFPSPATGCSVKAVCNCGETKTWTGYGCHLLTGVVKSCGCQKSAGEDAISHVLNRLKIPHLHNRTLSRDCADKKPLIFDFILDDGQFCIEYHGKQHYQPSSNWDFKGQKRRDQIKRDYCTSNGITLYEIPHTYFDQLPEIIEDLIVNELIWEFDYPEIKEPAHGL